MTVMNEIILVDETGRTIGYEEKMRAHRAGGKLHRAFSIFIFDPAGRMLLQKRSARKYHFGGLWTNACCSHPHRGEELEAAAHRRLREELGFDTQLKEVFTFTYSATDTKSGLTEREYDHVLTGQFHGMPEPNADEVDDWKWMDSAEVVRDLAVNAQLYTPWFAIACPRAIDLR